MQGNKNEDGSPFLYDPAGIEMNYIK